MSGPYYAEGIYSFRVKDQGFAETEKGTPYFFLRGEPAELIFSDGTEPCEKRYEREIVMYLTDKAVEYAVDKLRSLGWEGSSFTELDPTQAGGLTWIGQVIRAECKHRPGLKDPTKIYENWDLPFVEGDRPPKPKSDIKIAAKLDAMFSKIARSSAKAEAPKPSKPKREPITSGDDIPF